jgi:2-polyprenyl-3-methyl-5-hydroxy-6-metoxy-1,4-benzoquinol methylase
MKEIFDNYVETSFDGYNQEAVKIKQFEINYLKFFPTNKNAQILDIGIGRGEMLSCMKGWGYDYFGVDISPSTVRFCQSLNLKCEVTQDTAEWLFNKKGSFALITCLDVLEHVPRERTIDFLKAIRAGLSEGGHALIQVPNLQSPFGYLHHFNDFTHVNGFVEHSLTQVLLAAGFTEFKFYGFEEIYKTGFKQRIHKLVRYAYRRLIRFLRAVNVNPNPPILDPVLYVIAK